MKSYLNKVKRKRIDNTHNVFPRLHMSEKNEKFSDEFFSSFVKSLTQNDFSYYPDVTPLKEKIAKKHNVGIDNVFIGAGSDRVLSIIFTSLLNPDDIVYFPYYHFPMYDVYTEQNDTQTRFITFKNQLLDFDSIIDKPSLIVIDYPNTILGTLPPEKFLLKIKSLNVPVVIDYAYSDFSPKPNIDLNNFSVFTFSKGYGSAGIRVGYCISSKENIMMLEAYRDMFEISGPSIKYCCHLLDNEDEIINWRNMILSEKQKLSDIAILPKYGNWAFLDQSKFRVEVPHKFDILVPELFESPLIKISLCENIKSFIFRID